MGKKYERKYITESRQTRVMIDRRMVGLGYSPIILSESAIKGDFSWDRTVLYDGKKPADGIVILRFKDDDYGDPGDDYWRTEVNGTFIHANSKKVRSLDRLIKEEIKLAGKEDQ